MICVCVLLCSDWKVVMCLYEVIIKRVLIWQDSLRQAWRVVGAQWDEFRCCPSKGVQWQGRPVTGSAVTLKTDSHPQCLQYTQLLPGCIAEVSQQKQFGCLKYGLHTILRLYFTSSLSNTQACFYGIWSTLLNNLIVHCWPDSTFPDLGYKRKTASGKFSSRSTHAYSIIPTLL